jgi:single-stranded-DNA-specific exonuclease
MSFLGKKWIVRNTTAEKSTFEKILSNRGVADVNEGLTFHDPFLLDDMQKVVDRIKLAVGQKERVIVFGDYDVDGISGATIVINILKKLGAIVSYRLPHRVNDGYGLSEKFIDEFIAKDVNLVITVDCGISSNKEISKAKAAGIDVIITDHHTVPEDLSKDAYAILHPRLKDTKYPFPDLTGAGVALKLAQALLQNHEDKQFIEDLIALASLGTVADLGQLKGENRLIVKEGLLNLLSTRSSGLKKLIELAGMKEQNFVDSYTIGYRIAPRINAAGRIGDPYLALSLLLQNEESEKVNYLGQQLEDLNLQRQDMTEKAVAQAEAHFAGKEKIPAILIAESADWHVGILGLVAAKLVDKYNRPVIIMQDFGDVLVASARGPKFFHITEAITACGKYLVSFGGHAQAAGFNIKKENLVEFKKALEAYSEEKLQSLDLCSVLEIDCELAHDDVSFGMLDQLKTLEPFGVGNEKPTFLLSNLEPFFINQVGKENTHLKFTVKIQDKEVQVIAFNMGHFADEIRSHKKVDFVCNLDRNVWNNKEYIQFRAIDIRGSK